MTKIHNNATLMRSAFQNDANYILFKASNRYDKGKARVLWIPSGTLYYKQETLETLLRPCRDASGMSGSNWARQDHQGLLETYKGDQQLYITKEAQVTPSIHSHTDIKDILDVKPPQAYKAICRKNQYTILKHPISDAFLDCLPK